MRILKNYGVVACHGSKELRLQRVTVTKEENTVALVSYKDGMSVNATPFTREEAKALKGLLEDYLDYKVETIEVTEETSDDVVEVTAINETVKTLTSLTATDVNYQTALRNATIEDLEEAIAWMKSDNGKHGTRITFCERKLNTLKKRAEKKDNPTEEKPVEDKIFSETTAEEEDTAEEETTEEDTAEDDTTEGDTSEEEKEVFAKAPKSKEKNILQFPTEDKKPKFVKLTTEGKRTYKECEEKLGKEAKEFVDADSQYVIQGLLELAKVDQDFRNNLMREDKSYIGFMDYMYEAAKNGYCYRHNNTGWLDRDTGLALAIEYYNNDVAKIKADEEKKRKVNAEKNKAAVKKSSTTVKKSVQKKKTQKKDTEEEKMPFAE